VRKGPIRPLFSAWLHRSPRLVSGSVCPTRRRPFSTAMRRRAACVVVWLEGDRPSSIKANTNGTRAQARSSTRGHCPRSARDALLTDVSLSIETSFRGPLVAQTSIGRLAQPCRAEATSEGKVPGNDPVQRRSSPVVAMPDSACHAGGRGFESRRSRLFEVPANRLVSLSMEASGADFWAANGQHVCAVPQR
jgi:hypothetical protein